MNSEHRGRITMLGKILIFCMSTKQQKQGIDRIESTKKNYKCYMLSDE